jgi:hypothetical protein
MNQELKDKSNLLILSHSFIAIAVSILIYLYNPEFGRAVFLGSLAFNIYLRLLCLGFMQQLNVQVSKLTAMFSAFRAAITAAILAILILKFKLNLMGLGVAFLLYQAIFIGVGIYINASYNRRTSR